MIPPHTPPGTALVVVWEAATLEEMLDLVRPAYRWYFQLMWEDGFRTVTVLERCVLAEVELSPYPVCGYLCRLQGREGQYHPSHFAVASLPSKLTGLLASRPVLEDA